MAWRLAKSLDTLRAQVNALSPHRSKISDGTKGDDAHSKRKSDHNPDKSGVVRALDLTNDPAHGIDSEKLANALLASRDPRIKYIISNKKIASGAGGPKPWTWRPYSGSNAHNKHVHVSVVPGKAGDDTKPWNLNLTVPPSKAEKPVSKPALPVLSLGAKGPDVEKLQALLNTHGAKLTLDADFGARTKAALVAFQRKRGLKADGLCGPYCWEALLK